jgi:hypothetical protein
MARHHNGASPYRGSSRLRVYAAFVVALAALLGGAAAFAQQAPAAPQANGPPIPITPPASVYRQAQPSLAPPRATASRSQAPRAIAPRATATTTAAIVRVQQPAGLDCGGQLVVWANTASRIYHFSTSDYYGRTKVGAYMCESEAKAQGMRPGRTEVRP